MDSQSLAHLSSVTKHTMLNHYLLIFYQDATQSCICYSSGSANTETSDLEHSKTPCTGSTSPESYDEEEIIHTGTCTGDEFDAPDNDDDEEEKDNIEQLYLHNLALFYLRLQTKYHVPASTIQIVIDELNSINKIHVHRRQFMKSKLASVGLDSDLISQILSDVESQDLFSVAHQKTTGPLRSDFSRKEFYKSNMSFIEPVAIRLGIDENSKLHHYHYVPIKKSIETLFKDDEVQEQYHNPLTGRENVYSDFTDGTAYKNNELFSRVQGSVKLILYQDSFEIVNPLGSAKKKHKILAVYYSLGNLHPYNRSKIDPIQLVSLCKESDVQYFGQERFFSRLVADLKDIEDTGLHIGFGAKVKGSVVAFLGDNLGSHFLGGFLENFSVELDDKAIACHVELYRESVQQAVSSIPQLLSGSFVSNSCVVCGTQYSRGMHVILEKVDGNLIVGEVEMIIVSSCNTPFIVVKLGKCEYVANIGLHKLLPMDDELVKCVRIDKLLDYNPLHANNIKGGDTIIALKHSVVGGL
ncbi:uncharacterized protein LOC119733676 [Patiria miniata]|uniref:Uncharacterized protein n=1 Tax=Patiria miniata TaxID=46514 RepID=A0A914AHI9_PATMI|nr:uncharacterized protein LOC119733676 [Patiria miniata]